MGEFIETTNKGFIERHANEIWNIMQRSYSNIGGFLTYPTIDKMINNVSLMRYSFDKDYRICSAAIYDSRKDGQKLIGCGTLNGEKREKDILYDIVLDDTTNFSKWHWAEVSGAMERIFQKAGGNPIPSRFAKEILKKPLSDFNIDNDSHYYRLINNKWYRKIIYGFKDEETYHNVMNSFSKYTGFTDYKDWKKYTNSKNVVRIFEWEDCERYNRVQFCLDVCDRFIDLGDDNSIYEVPKAYYDFISSIYKEITENYIHKRSVQKRGGLLRAVKYDLSTILIIPEGDMKEMAQKIAMPILGKSNPWFGSIEDV